MINFAKYIAEAAEGSANKVEVRRERTIVAIESGTLADVAASMIMGLLNHNSLPPEVLAVLNGNGSMEKQSFGLIDLSSDDLVTKFYRGELSEEEYNSKVDALDWDFLASEKRLGKNERVFCKRHYDYDYDNARTFEADGERTLFSDDSGDTVKLVPSNGPPAIIDFYPAQSSQISVSVSTTDVESDVIYSFKLVPDTIESSNDIDGSVARIRRALNLLLASADTKSKLDWLEGELQKVAETLRYKK